MKNSRVWMGSKGRVFVSTVALMCSVAACTQSNDTCDDVEGTITHTVTEITGIHSVSILKRNSTDNTFEAVDQINGVEFSNLTIELDLSWIQEQHRFRTTNTIIQSAIDWFITPAAACSLAPYYDDYQPAISSIEIYSDTDLNSEYSAGSNLAEVFIASGVMNGSDNLADASQAGTLLSAQMYSLEPARLDGTLATIPTSPETHVLTIMLALDDGRVYEINTPLLLISGV